MATTTEAFSYDPSTAAFQEEIWDVYRWLRDEHPVYHDAGRGEYVLSRFDDVWRAVNDWESFSSVVAEAENFLPQMIYIDPPYNTGNDFIYPDDYSESLQTYLQYTGQVDAEGKKFSTNTETDGRFHSKWLKMMYPRL